MEKKRSKGVTFWAWVFIVFAIVGFLSVIDYKQQIQFFGVGMLFSSMAISFAYLVCGIYLLKLNNSARKAAIILSIISIIAIPFHFKPIMQQINDEEYYSRARQAIIEQTKPEFQQETLENFEKGIAVGETMLPIVMIIVGIPFLILELIPIYFFTRPKVKEQFK